MASNRSRGNDAEKYVQKHYQDQGYIVHRAYASITNFGSGPRSITHDLFGVFDMACKKKGEPPIYVQVSTGCRKAEKEKKILALGAFDGAYEKVEIWLYFGQGVWKIYELIEGSFQERRQIRGGKTYILAA